MVGVALFPPTGVVNRGAIHPISLHPMCIAYSNFKAPFDCVPSFAYNRCCSNICQKSVGCRVGYREKTQVRKWTSEKSFCIQGLLTSSANTYKSRRNTSIFLIPRPMYMSSLKAYTYFTYATPFHMPDILLLCLPSDHLRHELLRSSLMNSPRKKKTKGNQNTKGNLCTKSDSLLYLLPICRCAMFLAVLVTLPRHSKMTLLLSAPAFFFWGVGTSDIGEDYWGWTHSSSAAALAVATIVIPGVDAFFANQRVEQQFDKVNYIYIYIYNETLLSK